MFLLEKTYKGLTSLVSLFVKRENLELIFWGSEN